MSKRDIIAVTTLAAHLAYSIPADRRPGVNEFPATKCATDALALQKLGARARRNDIKAAAGMKTPQDAMQEDERIIAACRHILKPYGLSPLLLAFAAPDACLYIQGLPSNKPDSTTVEGFGI